MGSSTSKSIDPEAAVTPVGRWSYSRNVFQTSCMRPASGSSDSSDIDDDEDIDNQQVTFFFPLMYFSLIITYREVSRRNLGDFNLNKKRNL